MAVKLTNFINGHWQESAASEALDVINPATGEALAATPLCGASEVAAAADAATQAYPAWRRTPPNDRAQFLYKLKALLERDFDDIARTTTLECGKTLAESRGELQRAIENVEVACGVPILLQGYNSEDIAPGIDELMIRQPVGIAAIICPFNFPAMIPMWFLPYALACGNTCIVKPSEKVPMTMQALFRLIEEAGFPKGVVNLVNGSRDAVDAILDHPAIRAVSFVGSTPVARYVYSRATANGKRAQCQGGAKNPIIVLPDADIEMTVRIVADSSFGCAGQRCLASSVAIPVGDAAQEFSAVFAEAARSRVVGSGLDEGVEMGPVISHDSKARIESLIAKAAAEGAEILVDGRSPRISGYEAGSFVGPTVLSGLPAGSEVGATEIFGPVLTIHPVETIDDAIGYVNRAAYGNMACLFTSSGAAARKFRYEAEVGNVGINVGVAAPMAYFPFSGWKDSFFGDLHAQGRHGIEFYTQTKVVVERWPDHWSRKF
ncbi:MAG: CoA-acylating methylmalonate-semialdehyde dehydrogenase [Acidobacteria bacterium]|nr:CoA-acylating methylmalonate-semialdehyde dehydrogenase [Acidobacteriota bacterium]